MTSPKDGPRPKHGRGTGNADGIGQKRSENSGVCKHPPRLWGKLRKDINGNIEDWLALVDHCTDVASVFQALCRQDAIARALARAAGRQHLSPTHIDRLAVLAFLHDIGKCNHGFQAKALANPPRTAGHVRELSALICDDTLQPRFLDAISYPTLATWFDDEEGALRMLLASASHHGKPIELVDTEVHRQKPLWLAASGIDPIADIAKLLATARAAFPDAFTAGASPLTATPALQHRFAGLVMLADWLGSHAEGFFPFRHGHGSRVEFAREAAERSLRAIGLNLTDIRARLNPNRAFADLFSFKPEPTPLQAALLQPNDSPVLIAESETGSGKTEAALGHFFRLFATGAVDSLYFALPTRVAARELYERVLAFAKTAFGEGHPPVVLAVPGYAQVDGERAALPTPAQLWQDDATARRLERAWSAERPKRFLAAPIAVGTIDQALLSVMQVNHAHLRAVCLERALLVVDEVHASDTYMRGLLRALLDHHREAGGRALLLSATLGSDARTELLVPLNTAHATAPLAEASAQPYPAVTDSEGRIESLPDVCGREKRVRIEPVAHLSTPERIIPELLEAIEAGARVLVVLNTVSRVISLLQAAEQESALAAALFRIGDLICPHHGRFARADRLLLDQAVSAQFGKSSAAGPLLLIGSQTLEQSLDIDADYLVTDLCPMDVLLQRIGRLHRHDRPRPAGFASPRCTVLVPDDPTLESFFDGRGNVRGEAGLGKVYPDLRIARLTLECIGAGCEIRIPAENRALVEWTTHPENLARFDAGHWSRHRNEICARVMAHGQAAHNTLLQATEAFGDPALRFRALDEKLSTRLGLDDRRIPLTEPEQSPFSQTLFELAIPGWMAKGIDVTELDGPPTIAGRTLRFRYGGKAFRYTRLGLELDDER
ncbi:MAG: CRISPR-associated helicase Cas3' [Nitrococcus mobilis]|nr:CRISPR-associated helicase Cas3' [Nitrococcus mobilis]